RSRRIASIRSSRWSELALPLSSRPTRRPSSDGSRGASRGVAASLWLVGFTTVSGILIHLAAVLVRSPGRSGLDGPGDRERLVAVPGRHDRAETAGRAAGGHDQQVVRRTQGGEDPVLVAAHGRPGLSG